jgi:transmembrane sensor
MQMKRRRVESADTAAIAGQAASWLARRDRGLTPAEQDEYMQWLTADPRHAEVLAQHAAALERMMQLYEWQPGQSADANPDLFAPRKSRAWGRWTVSLAAAAVVALTSALWWRGDAVRHPGHAERTFLQQSESQVLADGTLVELKDGSRITVDFSPAERRVRLSGEAHFQVTKSTIPFVVNAGGVAVRAVGTAFNVRTESDSVEVLVTQGSGAVEPVPALAPAWAAGRSAEASAAPGTAPAARVADDAPPASAPAEPRLIVAGQRGVVALSAATELQVSEVTREEVQAALEWKVPRLQFFEAPLALAVEEFNRRNRVQLRLGQRDLAAVPIGGTFRVDNVEGFVRLLELTLDIRAERRGNGQIVLTRGR